MTNTNKPTIYPTMVVGVGGMGTNTVRAVKRRFRNAWGGDQLPGMIQLMALDTEPLVNRLDQEPLFADEFAYMGKFDATRLIDNLDQHPEIARWWNYPSIPLGYIHNGAKQLRPIGRLCFFRNYVTFKQLLETKLSNLDKIRDMETAQNRGFPVVGNYQLAYVVGSLCGGTGSGMFLDVAHRVRAAVRNNARVCGIFFLPDVLESEISSDLQRRRIRANAYAALKELNYFQQTQEFKALYPSEQRELPDTPYAPFDFIFLVGRTNRDGRSLARKQDAEQMAAHLIQMTAISHLSSEILGLEVNVVRERMFDVTQFMAAGEVIKEEPRDYPGATNGSATNGSTNGQSGEALRNFLVYSGFATSALVAPSESLVNFWQSAFVTDMIRRFAAGTSMNDPRSPLPANDRQRILNIWQALLAQLLGRYAALDNDRLPETREEILEQRGAWHGFWEPVEGALRQVLLETGVRGGLAFFDLVGPAEPAAAAVESLPRQRLFLIDNQAVTEEERNRWRRLLAQQGGFSETAQQIGSGFGDLLMMAVNPRQARERSRDMAGRRARARLYQGRDEVERTLIDQMRLAVSVMREALRSQIDACTIALARANVETNRLADLIDPRVADGSASTSMYYELETGAVGRDYLQHFYRRALNEVQVAERQALLRPLVNNLVQNRDAVGAGHIYNALRAGIAENEALVERVQKSVDINHVIATQYDTELAVARQRPDNRVTQWLDRLNPYLRWDADRFSFHESNLEHIRLASVPVDRREDATLAAATVGQEDIRWIPTGDKARMDAVWIVHGLPVTLLERMDEYRAQYENRFDFSVKQEFHLDPAWADLPEITLTNDGFRDARLDAFEPESPATIPFERG